jgi:hypothetical protein
MTFLRIVISLYLFCLSMIFSENRYTLFRIMLYAHDLSGSTSAKTCTAHRLEVVAQAPNGVPGQILEPQNKKAAPKAGFESRWNLSCCKDALVLL